MFDRLPDPPPGANLYNGMPIYPLFCITPSLGLGAPVVAWQRGDSVPLWVMDNPITFGGMHNRLVGWDTAGHPPIREAEVSGLGNPTLGPMEGDKDGAVSRYVYQGRRYSTEIWNPKDDARVCGLVASVAGDSFEVRQQLMAGPTVSGEISTVNTLVVISAATLEDLRRLLGAKDEPLVQTALRTTTNVLLRMYPEEVRRTDWFVRWTKVQATMEGNTYGIRVPVRRGRPLVAPPALARITDEMLWSQRTTWAAGLRIYFGRFFSLEYSYAPKLGTFSAAYSFNASEHDHFPRIELNWGIVPDWVIEQTEKYAAPKILPRGSLEAGFTTWAQPGADADGGPQ
jgi:hypothetical protein